MHTWKMPTLASRLKKKEKRGGVAVYRAVEIEKQRSVSENSLAVVIVALSLSLLTRLLRSGRRVGVDVRCRSHVNAFLFLHDFGNNDSSLFRFFSGNNCLHPLTRYGFYVRCYRCGGGVYNAHFLILFFIVIFVFINTAIVSVKIKIIAIAVFARLGAVRRVAVVCTRRGFWLVIREVVGTWS